jgi:hypothetical protein
MILELSAQRLWKRLGAADRQAAASHLFAEPAPEAVAGAFGVIARARRMRPQAVRAMAPEAQARAVASILDPGEALAASLLVALHLGARRDLLKAFLDAMGLPHEDGILTDDADKAPAPTLDGLRQGIKALASFPKDQVATYLNTLYLQDPERWSGLAEVDGVSESTRP